MAAFLIARLPSHPKSLDAVVYMQRNEFSFRISTNMQLVNILMSSEGGDSRQQGIFEELKLAKEEVHVIDNFTCIFPSNNKVEVNSRENSPPNEKPVPIECIFIEEDDISTANQSDDQKPRLEIVPEAVQLAEPLEIPIVLTEQVGEEVVDDYQEEPEEETNCFLGQAENDDLGRENVLIADDHEFNGNTSEILSPVAEQEVQAIRGPDFEEIQLEVEEDEERMESGEYCEATEDGLLEAHDTDNSTVALRPLRNNYVLFDFEDSLNDELQVENEITEHKDCDEEVMEEFEEDDEELVEEQEHEVNKVGEDVDEQMDVNSNDDEDLEEESGTAQKKKGGQPIGDPIARLLFTCFAKNCPSSFNTFKELEEHVKVHPGKQDFFCDVCKKKFSSKAAALRHIRLREKKKCCACGQKAVAANILVRHHRCHTGERPFACKTCGKRFSLPSVLKTHMMTHTGEKRFYCDICKKGFALKQNFETHKRSHTGEKLYSCGFCEKRFSRGTYLKNHEVTHTGKKPFECKECGKGFIRRDHLNGHLRKHTGEKPFSCKKCEAKFAHLASLNYHTKKHR